jgi:hypothetical protein
MQWNFIMRYRLLKLLRMESTPSVLTVSGCKLTRITGNQDAVEFGWKRVH